MNMWILKRSEKKKNLEKINKLRHKKTKIKKNNLEIGSSRADRTESFDPLLPYNSWLVLSTAPCVHTELKYASLRWSVNTGVSM